MLLETVVPVTAVTVAVAVVVAVAVTVAVVAEDGDEAEVEAGTVRCGAAGGPPCGTRAAAGRRRP
uniref:hypothetical protein n=1 Tax=Streptomyces sp. CRN 30 TaxID=3075613 RepID=UPI002A837EFA